MDCYKLLSDTISNLIERYVPKKKFKTKKTCLWFNRKVKRLLDVEMVFNGDVSQKLSSIIITSEDVMSKINNFKDGKAPGNDGIIPEFLKRIVKEISEPLAIEGGEGREGKKGRGGDGWIYP